MDRVAVFVDAGYFFAQAAQIQTGNPKTSRDEFRFDHEAAIRFLVDQATKTTGLSLLRVYWYDGVRHNLSATHQKLASTPCVKFRAGVVSFNNEQKGVDSLLVSDLIDLSRAKAMCEVLLVTGDDDIRVGVWKAQEQGVRIHVVGIGAPQANVSHLLRDEADSVLDIDSNQLASFIKHDSSLAKVARIAPAAAPTPPPPPGVDMFEHAAQQFLLTMSAEQIDDVKNEPRAGFIPGPIEYQFFGASKALIGNNYGQTEKIKLRRALANACKTR